MTSHSVSYAELIARRQNLRDTIMALSKELNIVELAIRSREDSHGQFLGQLRRLDPARYDTTLAAAQKAAVDAFGERAE